MPSLLFFLLVTVAAAQNIHKPVVENQIGRAHV